MTGNGFRMATVHDNKRADAREITPRKRSGTGLVPDAMIEKLVRTFYGQIQQHPSLGPVFAKAIPGDWEPHLRTMMTFWSSVINTTGRYKGQPVPKHVALEGITHAHFDEWLALFEACAVDVCGDETALLFVSKAERIAESLKFAMFGLPGLPNRIHPVGGRT